MVFLVKIYVVLVRLSVEYLVEMRAGVHLWWSVCGCEPFQRKIKGTQGLFEPGNVVITPVAAGLQWDGPIAFCHLQLLSWNLELRPPEVTGGCDVGGRTLDTQNRYGLPLPPQ